MSSLSFCYETHSYIIARDSFSRANELSTSADAERAGYNEVMNKINAENHMNAFSGDNR